MFVSTTIMQFASAGKRPFREKAHAGDPCLQACDGDFAIYKRIIDGFQRQTNTLIVPKRQVGRWLQDAVGVDGLNYLRHRNAPEIKTMASWTPTQSKLILLRERRSSVEDPILRPFSRR
jgi:hypothetical protein